MESGGTNTYQKARRINLEPSIHGTFAEIGAGQEVARWFFHVGGAAGTVAKTISAYDMAVSDAIYGPTNRYVSRRRLLAMLDYEFELLIERLGKKRGATTQFFVFADTLATGKYAQQTRGHGWMGIRFQHKPESEPCEVLLHLHMLDTENMRQQETLGILGVNLVYGALFYHDEPTRLIRSLMDNLASGRIEIDMIRFTGPFFAGVDNRLMCLELVEQGFTNAVMFGADGEVIQPAEILYKKPVLMVRGSFRPVTYPTMDMLERSAAKMLADPHTKDESPIVVMEMSLRNLLDGDRIDHSDFLARVDILRSLGKTVMITSCAAYYSLAAFLWRYTHNRAVFAMGITNLRELFNETYYTDLDGGILEAFGQLFKAGVKLYVYPYKDPETGALIRVETLSVPVHLRSLYKYFLENKMIEPIEDVNEKNLHIFPRDVLAKIQSGDSSWETMVPEPAVQLIKDRHFFSFRPSSVPREGARL